MTAETINMRTDSARKRRLQLAADLSHESLTAFVLSAADEKAERIISESRSTPLPAEFFEEFFSALASEPIPAMRAAARRHRRMVRRGD